MNFFRGKVTFLISSLSGGGAENVCVNLANELADYDWEVELVILNLNNSAFLNRLSEKVNLVILGVNHVRNSCPALLGYINQTNPNAILVFNYELTVILLILRRVFRFKTKIITRNISTLSQKRVLANDLWSKYVVMPLVIKFYHKSDHIINQCEAMREDLISLYPKIRNKTSVIYNPLNRHIEEYVTNNDILSVEKNDYLLCVGRLENVKAFDIAIKAFANLSREYLSLRLKIIGKGSLEVELKELASQLGVADRVDFEGFQKNIIPYYLHAKATLLTSLYEGFPNVLLESISLATPVVAFDCPSGPREIIIDGSNGYLIKDKCLIDLDNKLRLTLNRKWDYSAILESSKLYYKEKIIHNYIRCFRFFEC